MNPLSSRTTTRAWAGDAGEVNDSQRFPPMLSWVAGLWLLLLAGNPYFFISDWPLVDTPDRSLLGAENVWNPPIARLLEGSWLSAAPFWLCALVVAAILADGARRACLDGMPWPLVLVVMIGLANIDTRTTLATIACIWLSSKLARRAKLDRSLGLHTWQNLLLATGVFSLALATTLEVGLVACVLTLQAVMPAILYRPRHLQRRQLAAALGWMLIITLPGFFISGYVPLMLRFVNWLWLQPPIELMPSMSLLWQADAFTWPHMLVLLMLAYAWLRGLEGRLDAASLLLLCLLTIIGLGCARYYWISSLSMLLLCIQQPSADAMQRPQLAGEFTSQRSSMAGWLVAASGVLALVVQLVANASTIFAADVITRRLSASQWNISGAVLLTNLEQAEEWQRHTSRGARGQMQYQPILTDRWEIFYADYQDYAAVCRDWANWKREAYLRSDGRWGGYQSTFSRWQPVLVVVDSEDLESIRRVSLDSQWKVLGIDHAKTVFAQAESPATRAYVQYANRVLLTAEFPRPVNDVDFARVLALGDRSDALMVSAVLTSLRLPFAGLRVLPQSLDPAAGTSAALAYAELANRTHRYSGRFSLLDNVRALGNPQRLGGKPFVVSAAERYRENLRRLTAEHRFMGTQDDPQHEIRRALVDGEAQKAVALIDSLEHGTTADFYYILAAAANQPATATLSQLQALAVSGLPDDLSAERNFYLGCLANELGDVGLARSAFAEVERLPAGAAFSSIVRFYQSQIGP